MIHLPAEKRCAACTCVVSLAARLERKRPAEDDAQGGVDGRPSYDVAPPAGVSPAERDALALELELGACPACGFTAPNIALAYPGLAGVHARAQLPCPQHPER